MNAKIDHVAVNVNDFEWHVRFFQDVFGMTIEKSEGERPGRKVWFTQGIQLNETADALQKFMSGYADHIGIRTDDMETVLSRSREYGCWPVPGKGRNWFQLPGGIVFELK